MQQESGFESQPDMNWLLGSTLRRKILFGEGIEGRPREYMIDDLASLALAQFHYEAELPLDERPNNPVRSYSQVRESVNLILERQNMNALHPRLDNRAHFMVTPAYMPIVSEVVSNTIWTWDRVGLDQGSHSTFCALPRKRVEPKDFWRHDVRLVLETAAAACDVLQMGYDIDNKAASPAKDRAELTYGVAGLLTYHGPGYARGWLQGREITKYCMMHGLNIDHWLEKIDTRQRVEAALLYPQNPMKGLEPIIGSHRLINPLRSRDWSHKREMYKEWLYGVSGEWVASIKRSLGQTALAERLDGPLSRQEQLQKHNLTENVKKLLELHTARARHAPDDAIFGITSPDNLERVAETTAHVMWLWRRAVANRRRSPDYASVLPFSILTMDGLRQDDKTDVSARLALETAASVCEILSLGYPRGQGIDTGYGRLLAAFIAKRGPEFAAAWVRGDIVRQAYPAEADKWLSLFTPSTLADMAIRHANDPVAKLREAAEYFDTVFTTDNLRKITGWPADKVWDVFVHSTLEQIARCTTDPVSHIRRVAYNVDRVMTTFNLSSELGITPSEALIIFPRWARLKLSRIHTNPIEAAKVIVPLYKELQSKYGEGVPDKVLAFLANNFRSTADRRARRYMLHFKVTFKNENLEEITGWSRERIWKVFTKDDLAQIGMREDNPAPTLRRIVKNFDTIMPIENLARELDMPQHRVRRLVPFWVRAHLAVKHAHPLPYVRQYAQLATELAETYQFSNQLLSYLAYNYPTTAHERAKQVVVEYGKQPRGVSDRLWASVVARHPTPGDKRRDRLLLAYEIWQRSLHERKLDKAVGSSETKMEYADPNSGQTWDVAETTEHMKQMALRAVKVDQPTADVPTSDILLLLAEKAGLTPLQLQELLAHFADMKDTGSSPDLGDLAKIFQELQAAIGKVDQTALESDW